MNFKKARKRRAPSRFLSAYRLLFCFLVPKTFFDFDIGGHFQLCRWIGSHEYICGVM